MLSAIILAGLAAQARGLPFSGLSPWSSLKLCCSLNSSLSSHLGSAPTRLRCTDEDRADYPQSCSLV